MSSPTTPRCTHGVLSLDTPDRVPWGTLPVGEPSADLLDRALVGWELFRAGAEQSDG